LRSRFPPGKAALIAASVWPEIRIANLK